METVRGDPFQDATFERFADHRWNHWPVFWSPVWVGALASLAIGLVIGLIAAAVGAHEVGPSSRAVTYHDIRFGALVFGVLGSFLAFFAGGWIAARIAGLRRSEPAMLHGAITWLVAVPLLLLTMALGAGSLYGDWYGGMAGRPAWVADPAVTGPNAPANVVNPARPAAPNALAVADADAARAARNTALGTLTALLLGLVGAVIGGWAASGEPMTFTHYRTRTIDRDTDDQYVASTTTAHTVPTTVRPAA